MIRKHFLRLPHVGRPIRLWHSSPGTRRRHSSRTLSAPIQALETRVLLAAQVVTPSNATPTVEVGGTLTFDANYSTVAPLADPITGLELSLHYDSSIMSLDSVSNLLPQGTPTFSDRAETVSDDDPSTDREIHFLWFDALNSWPDGATLPARLFTANFTATLTPSATTIGFTGKTAAGYDFQSTPVQVTVAPRTFTVDLGTDESDGDFSTGDLSLREAVEQANVVAGTAIVNFASALNGQTINLSGTSITITDDITINGPGADQLTISGNNAVRIFDVSSGRRVAIDGVRISNGASAVDGGGIRNAGTLTVTNSVVSNNVTSGSAGGAGISNTGTLKIENSTLSGNTAAGSGGAVRNTGTLRISNSTLSGNQAAIRGGGDSQHWNFRLGQCHDRRKPSRFR